MRITSAGLLLLSLVIKLVSCTPRTNSPSDSPSNSGEPDLTGFPALEISNEQVAMKVYLPDTEKGLYRGTRFDWSGVIGSVRYDGHEYFGYWKKTQDPLFHEDLTGPVEGFIEPGLGFADAKPGEGFIRIGVGILEKERRKKYNWRKTYNVLDHGTWSIDHGKDWVTFSHQIESDFGYGYLYTKTIRLKNDGFAIIHDLQNTGEKAIETDQFNHNFFMIDGERSGTSFRISFPYDISTADKTNGYVEINDNELNFVRDLYDDFEFLTLEGYGGEIADHKVTVENLKSGAGVTFTVDRPLHRMVFWACETTLSPENFIWLSVKPGQRETWTSEYTLFANH
jgi:hypothetical protein